MSFPRSGANRWAWVAVAIAIAACASCTEAAPAAARPDAALLTEFAEHIRDYVAVHDRVAASVGPRSPSASPGDIAAREAALGRGLRIARAGARRGEILTPRMAPLFRAIIRRELAHRAMLPRRDRDDGRGEVPEFVPRVNQIYPASEPLTMTPPGVLRALPRLPEPLEYRFVRQHLILRDREANLIVDVLAGAATLP